MHRRYTEQVSRRPKRDPAAIRVLWPAGGIDIGTGTAEEGGGPLDGNLVLANRATVGIDDPAVPYEIELTVAAVNRTLAAEDVRLRRRGDGPAVTSTALRGLVVETYIARVREEVGHAHGGAWIKQVTEQTPTSTTYSLVNPDRWNAFEHAQRRRDRPTPGLVAQLYRDALASPDPKDRKAPTATVARRLNYHRGHAARLVAQARAEGLLGPAHPGRAGEASPDPLPNPKGSED